MLNQLTITGKTKLEMTLDRLKRYEPEEGYKLAFSGGKDSVTIKALADIAGVKYHAKYRVTSVDPPELVEFVKSFQDVEMELPRYKDGSVVTMWNLIPRKRMPPTRLARYCCEFLKESGAYDGFNVTGVRWAESSNRQNNRGGLELSNRKGESAKYDPDATVDITQYKYKTLNPIIDWSDAEVWEFINGYNVRYCELYDKGYKRLGCVGCPMATNQIKELEAYPKYKAAYMRAFEKMLERNRRDGIANSWNTPEEVMEWWTGWRERGKREQR